MTVSKSSLAFTVELVVLVTLAADVLISKLLAQIARTAHTVVHGGQRSQAFLGVMMLTNLIGHPHTFENARRVHDI
jgi:hypothetical protein